MNISMSNSMMLSTLCKVGKDKECLKGVFMPTGIDISLFVGPSHTHLALLFSKPP